MTKKAGESLKSYAPWSGKQEFCFLEGTSGTVYPGVRVENISFPLTIPAVQAAVCSCLGNHDQPAVLYHQKPMSANASFWIEEYSLSVKQTTPDSGRIYNPLITLPQNRTSVLKEINKKAVVPHSEFPVSAVLETNDGLIPGVNIEVSAWNLGLCAERVAIARALAAGYTAFNSIHIYAPNGDFISPCGACRQILAEWLPDKKVELHHGDGTVSTHFTSHLLPYGFTSKVLNP